MSFQMPQNLDELAAALREKIKILISVQGEQTWSSIGKIKISIIL